MMLWKENYVEHKSIELDLLQGKRLNTIKKVVAIAT